MDSVAYSSNKTSETMKKNILGKMAELFEERLCKMVQNYRHVMLPHLAQGQKTPMEHKMNVSWTAVKEK